MMTAVLKNTGSKILSYDYDINRDGMVKCPHCGEELVFRNGDINIPHFAHKKGSDCIAEDNDMSEWHRAWQNMFSVERQEVPMQKVIPYYQYCDMAERWSFSVGNDNASFIEYRDEAGRQVPEKVLVRHRADVAFMFMTPHMDLKQYIVEFQKSPISPEKVTERTAFYSSMGYKVIWIFDCDDCSDNMQVYDETDYCEKWEWRYPKNFLRYIPPHNDYIKDRVSIWFCFGTEYEYVNGMPFIKDTCLYHVTWANPYDKKRSYNEGLYNSVTRVPYMQWTRFTTEIINGSCGIGPYEWYEMLKEGRL